jgi:hypothetical protein
MVQTGNGISGCLADRSSVIYEKPRMSRGFESLTFHKSMTIDQHCWVLRYGKGNRATPTIVATL